VARVNAELGDAEVWTARATATTPGAITVKAMPGKTGFDIAMTVVSYLNAGGIGATGTFHAPAGAPRGTVTTTQDNSWVWAVGNDWLNASHRSVGPDQTLVRERLTRFGDTYWGAVADQPHPGVRHDRDRERHGSDGGSLQPCAG
jgi:hypothetical protein